LYHFYFPNKPYWDSLQITFNIRNAYLISQSTYIYSSPQAFLSTHYATSNNKYLQGFAQRTSATFGFWLITQVILARSPYPNGKKTKSTTCFNLSLTTLTAKIFHDLRQSANGAFCAVPLLRRYAGGSDRRERKATPKGVFG
jgi:hypothetical protein